MKDGQVQRTDPEGLVAYTSTRFRDWFNDIPYA
jgi:hypothetical protein